MKYLYIIASLLILSSCYRDINLDEYKDDEGENILTINSIVNPDSLINAYATRTYYYPNPHDAPVYVKDLDFELWVNNDFIQKMAFNPTNNTYESSVYPKVGDNVEIRTKFRDREITASGTVPKKVEIENIEAKLEGPMYIYWANDMLYTYYITFTDDPNEENYYFLLLLDKYDWNVDSQDYDGEFVFQQLKQQIDDTMPGYELNPHNGLPFSDVGINGKTHTLVIKEVDQNSGYAEPRTEYIRKFRLYSISKDYYKYLFDIMRLQGDSGISGGMIDIGVAEPIKIFSNIDGGVGILGCYNMDEVVIDIVDQKDSQSTDIR